MYSWSSYDLSAVRASLPLGNPDYVFEMERATRLWGLDKRLWRLPFEIQLQIINLLSIETKLSCLQVSKPWHSHLLDSAFWTSLHSTERFRNNERPANKPSYMKAITYAQGGLLDLDVAFPDLLTQRVLRHLRTLSIPDGGHLQSLSLVNCSRERFDRILNRGCLDFCANTLQHLRLENWRTIHLPSELPALQTLEISTCRIGDAAHCPLLTTFSTFASWRLTESHSTQLLIPNARAVHLSFMYFAYRLFRVDPPAFSELEQILMMKCYDLEELSIEVIDRVPPWPNSGYQRNSMQLEMIVRILEPYGRNLKSLTLRNPYQTDDTLVAAFRLCPRLAGIHVYQTRQGLHPHFDDNDRFGAHQWTVLDSNDCLYSYHLRAETL